MTDSSRSLTPIISEKDFLGLVEERATGLLGVLSVLEDDDFLVNKLYYFTVMQEADRLESFLDDHGARTNLSWLYFAEIVACVRNFSIAGSQIYHVLDRYPDYLGDEKDPLRRDFQDKAFETLEYFTQVLKNFHGAMLEEVRAKGSGITIKPVSTDEWRLKVNPQLPYTISEEEAADEEERVIAIAQLYRKVVKNFKQSRLSQRIKGGALAEIVPSKINETLMSEFEIKLHTIQSEYDTYIKGGRIERENPDIKTLRGLVAIPMHLFDALKWLVHFFERHENEIRKSDVKAAISEMVNNDKLYESIAGFGVRFCGRYLNEGNKVAERILSSFVKPITYTLPIPKPQGFHARPATYVSLVVQEHGTDVFMIVDGERFDCRSVLEILQAGGMMADSGREEVVFEGDKRALDDLKILADHNYCEDQDIPPELSYIRIMRNL